MGAKLERKGKYSIEAVLSKRVNVEITTAERFVTFDGDKVSMNSVRYACFAEHGTVCQQCGIEGKFFAKERTPGSKERYHFNLYSVDAKGKEVLMTKYRTVIEPMTKSQLVPTLITLCESCNSKLTKVRNGKAAELNKINVITEAKTVMTPEQRKFLVKYYEAAIDRQENHHKALFRILVVLKDECNHEAVVKVRDDVAVCDTCGTNLGWWCNDSPAHFCQYDDEHGKDCIYCGLPIERK